MLSVKSSHCSEWIMVRKGEKVFISWSYFSPNWLNNYHDCSQSTAEPQEKKKKKEKCMILSGIITMQMTTDINLKAIGNIKRFTMEFLIKQFIKWNRSMKLCKGIMYFKMLKIIFLKAMDFYITLKLYTYVNVYCFISLNHMINPG